MSFDWSFEHDITDRFNCRALSFDPSMGVGKMTTNQAEKYRNINLCFHIISDDFCLASNIEYYNLGIRGSTPKPQNKWKLASFKEILAQHNHEDVSLEKLLIFYTLSYPPLLTPHSCYYMYTYM